MKWEKKGLLYSPDGSLHWNKYYGILPTPYVTKEDALRVYFASTDSDRMGSISYIELDASNPSKQKYLEKEPILKPGQPGAFDDCGCNPSSILRISEKVYLYYAGYQRSYKTPYSIFSGLAESFDDGRTFRRVSQTPILERTSDELTIRSAPSVIYHEGRYLMWYVSATGWELMNFGIFSGRSMPRYIIKSAESTDAVHWQTNSSPSITYRDNDEFGFGRPWVIWTDGMFKMWYSIRRRNVSYRIGYAESNNGVDWIRKDNEVGIDVSAEGWDSEMICYPAVIQVKGHTYLFYNGNNNGETGFGWAELTEGSW